MNLIVLVIVLVLLFGGSAYYVAPGDRGPYWGGSGIGVMLLVLLILYLLGFFGPVHSVRVP